MIKLITGSNGFIGRELSKYGSNRTVSRRSSSNINSQDTFLVDQLDGNTNWCGAFDSVDCVIHLAAVAHTRTCSLEELQKVNVEGTLHLAIESAKAGVKRFLFVSSIGVNGSVTKDKPFLTDSICSPHNIYAQSKYDAELGLKKIAEETGLEVVIVRPTLVYGPNAPGNFGLLAKFVKKFPVLPFGLANNKRDFIAVQNLADLLITCTTHPNAAGHTFLASDMETVSIKQFTNAIANGLDKKVFQLTIPVSLMRLVGKLIGKSAMVEQLVGNLQVDSSNIKEVLDWTPPLTMKQAMTTLRDSGKSSSGKE
ncbi:NAD-dependent epimerase/dehydratase family protein [Shewanella putrefaciens]|uniref:NAD-dependent epimerase/dehydratase family protein n=1 Tax=Shewanella putrefaciens TaxID=24 RepID=UPI003D79E2C9